MNQLPVIEIAKEKVSCWGGGAHVRPYSPFVGFPVGKTNSTQIPSGGTSTKIISLWFFLCLHLLDERGQEVAALHKSDLPQPHQPLSQAVDVYTILGTLLQTVCLRWTASSHEEKADKITNTSGGRYANFQNLIIRHGTYWDIILSPLNICNYYASKQR